MGKKAACNVDIGKKDDSIFFDALTEGSVGPITVMICRKWDVNNVKGRYMGTDYVLSDEKGRVIHCTTKSNIAHRFINKLEEGSVYTIKDFVVHLSKPEYRVIQTASYIIELDGDTDVWKIEVPTGGFLRYPFDLVEFESLKPSEKKHMFDVIGCVLSVGQPSITSNGSKTLEFNLVNLSGNQLRVTLWGKLGDELIRHMGERCDGHCVILTAMLAKIYADKLYISSSSATIIFDSKDIPAINEFSSQMRKVDLKECVVSDRASTYQWGTVATILDWGRTNGKTNNVTYMCKVEIASVITKNSWYNLTCTNGKCRKGCDRVDGKFRCPRCGFDVLHPRVRFRLHLDVKDETGHFVVVCFDETVEKLTKTTARELLASDDSSLPKCLLALVGTTQTFEMCSITYYQYRHYESFKCNKVLLGEQMGDEVVPVSPNNAAGSSQVISPVVKPRENIRRNMSEDSETKECAHDGVLEASSNDRGRKKLRYAEESELRADSGQQDQQIS